MTTQRFDRLVRGFGRRLRAARIMAGYDGATEFARLLGLEGPRYRKYERGQSVPPIDVLEDISKKLNISLDWLLLGRPASGQPSDPRRDPTLDS